MFIPLTSLSYRGSDGVGKDPLPHVWLPPLAAPLKKPSKKCGHYCCHLQKRIVKLKFKRNFCIPLRSGCDLLTLGLQMALRRLLLPGASKMAPEWLQDDSQMTPRWLPYASQMPLSQFTSSQSAQASQLSSASSAQASQLSQLSSKLYSKVVPELD